MTQAELNSFYQNNIAGKTAAQIAEQIYALTGTSITGGYTKEMNDAVIGKDVKDDIVKLSMLIRAYNDLVYGEAESIPENVQERLSALELSIGSSLLTPTLNDGYIYAYSDGTGEIVSSQTDFSYSEPIQLLKGETISVTASGWGVVVAFISTCNSDKSNIKWQSKSANANVVTSEYTAAADCYVMVCGNKANGIFVYKYNSFYAEADGEKLEQMMRAKNMLKIDDIALNKGSYINSAGSITSQSSFSYTNPIPLTKNEKIVVRAAGYSGNVAFISTCSVNGDNIVVQVKDKGFLNDKPDIVSFRAPDDCYVMLSGKTSVGIYAYKEVVNDLAKNVDYSVLFSKVVCIGDSLTSGVMVRRNQDNTTTSRVIAECSYPACIAKMTGWDVTNLGHGGATATYWYNTYGSRDFSEYDCALICLGRNPENQGFATSDTDKQAYRNIINKLLTDNPHMHIFALAVPCSYLLHGEDDINAAIKEIADSEGVVYLDINTNSAIQTYAMSAYMPVDGIHYNRIGYATLAQTILDNMKQFFSARLLRYASWTFYN